MHPARTAIMIVGLVAVGAACSGDDGATTSTTVAAETTLPAVTVTLPAPPDVTEQYFTELASPTGDPGVAAVLQSDAGRYAEHLRLSRTLVGEVPTTATVTASDGNVEVCDGSACVVYDRIITDPTTGRLVTFAIDGEPLTGRLSGTGLPTDDDGVIGRTITAYRSNADQVLVVVEVSNTTDIDVEVFGFAAVLRPAAAASGREAVSVWGESEIVAGGSGNLLLVFDTDADADGESAEGRLQLNGLRADGIEFELDMSIPTPG